MNGELFPAKAVTMLSPRLKWMKAHGVVTKKRHFVPAVETWIADLISAPWPVGYGPTEEEACRDLGVKAGLRLWNEEGA
jgi:hypothetical protein